MFQSSLSRFAEIGRSVLVIALAAVVFPAFGDDVAVLNDGFDRYPEKADMLVVVAHPDDETTFGGLLSYYAYCQQKKVVFICLTSGEWGNGLPHHTKRTDKPDYSYNDEDEPRFEKIPADALYPCYYREQELGRALAMHGVRYRPIMPRYKDMSGLQPWGEPEPAFALWGGRQKVVGYLVSQIRRFQPDVVVSLAANGFNGNPEHMGASRGTVLACEVSGDDRQFAEQLGELDVWEPAKVYLHVAPDESYDVVHKHSWELDCQGTPGLARIFTARANALHESQGMKKECDESSEFILIQTAVGPDKVGKDDLFENVRLEPVE